MKPVRRAGVNPECPLVRPFKPAGTLINGQYHD